MEALFSDSIINGSHTRWLLLLFCPFLSWQCIFVHQRYRVDLCFDLILTLSLSSDEPCRGSSLYISFFRLSFEREL